MRSIWAHRVVPVFRNDPGISASADTRALSDSRPAFSRLLEVVDDGGNHPVLDLAALEDVELVQQQLLDFLQGLAVFRDAVEILRDRSRCIAAGRSPAWRTRCCWLRLRLMRPAVALSSIMSSSDAGLRHLHCCWRPCGRRACTIFFALVGRHSTNSRPFSGPLSHGLAMRERLSAATRRSAGRSPLMVSSVLKSPEMKMLMLFGT
jgi:hypothetical protein